MAAIPKIIHYCWFGDHPLPPLAQDCLDSWKLHCPDYEIKRWDEQTSKSYFNRFCQQAYREGKFAFVSDCVRVQVLHDYGGIYLDTDMVLVKPLDPLLKYDFFSAYEVPGRVNYSFFGGRAGNRIFALMSAHYQQSYFNRYSLPVITHLFKDQVQSAKLKANEVLFDPEFCYPMPFERRDEDYEKFIAPETFGVHLWDHSWQPKKKESLAWLLKHFFKVHGDYYFHQYPKAYFRRYRKEFARKIYHILIGKRSA